jgi:hypothetical protein
MHPQFINPRIKTSRRWPLQQVLHHAGMQPVLRGVVQR